MPFPGGCGIIQLDMAKQEDISRAYLFRGDDDFLKEREVETLVKSLVSEDFADFDLERLDGDSVTADRLIGGLSTAPMGSDRRVLLIKHAQKISKEEQEKLAAKLDSIPKTGCLILVNPAVERVDGKPRKGSEVIGDLSRAVRKVGKVRDIGGGQKPQKQAAAREFAQSAARDAGKKIDSQAMAVLIQRVGTDLSVLKTEVEKLVAYSGDAPVISAADVSAVTTETPEEKVFNLVDAIGAKNQPQALKLLDELFETAGSADAAAPRTLAMIARQFRLIWQIKLLQAAGVRDMRKSEVPDEIKQQLPSDPNILDILSRQAWQQQKLGRQASGFTRQELARAFLLVARADRMLKGIEGGIEDSRVVMELLVVELSASKKAFAGRS